MHRRHRRDNTHKDIKDGLLKAGFSVADTADVDEFVDLVAGKHGIDIKIECKTPKNMLTAKGRRKTASGDLRDGQRLLADTWRGTPVIPAYCLEDVLYAFSMIQKRMGWVK